MNSMIGLELREDYIQLAYVNKKHNDYKIKRHELDLMNYSIDKLVQIKEVILNYKSEFNIKTKNIFVVLNNKDIILRLASFNKVSNKDLKNVIANSFEDYLPIDLNNYILDYKIIYQDKGKTDVLLVASDCELSANTVSILKSLNLRPFNINIFHNCITSYISKIDTSSCLLVMTYFNKIYIVNLLNGHIKNLRETLFNNTDNSFELKRIVNSNNFKYDKVYVYSDEEWIKDYFETSGITVEMVTDNSIFVKGFM